MTRHPGGEEHTRQMLELSGLEAGARILDMGAGDGGAVRLMKDLGCDAVGIDLEPCKDVAEGNLLRCPYHDGSFDGVLSQCSFTLTGDVPAAFREAYRLLAPGGTLMYSDIDLPGTDAEAAAERAGFAVVSRTDLTPQWREYYLESLWSGTAEALPCSVPKGGCGYVMLICRKE